MRDGGTSSDAGFQLHCDRSLRREGLRGRITARVDGSTLHFADEHGGNLALPAGLVERIRFGRVLTRSSGALYRVLIWRLGKDRPLLLTVVGGQAEYGRSMRRFAVQVRAGGQTRVECGSSPLLTGLAYPLLVLGFGIMAVGAAVEALRGGTAWYWLYAALMALVTIYAAQAAIAGRPRPVRDLAELDAVLPPG